MNTEPITKADRKKYIKEALKYHRTLSKSIDKAVDYYLQKLDAHLDWLDDSFKDLDTHILDVLEADTAEDARKLTQAFKERFHL